VTTTDDLPQSSAGARRSLYLDTGDQLYVGGVPAHAYNALPAEVRSRDGFVGCLAELRLDGAHSAVDLLGNPFGIPELYRRQIRSGCPEWDVNGSGKTGCKQLQCDAMACLHAYIDILLRCLRVADVCEILRL
jgi:Laminin G domain